MRDERRPFPKDGRNDGNILRKRRDNDQELRKPIHPPYPVPLEPTAKKQTGTTLSKKN